MIIAKVSIIFLFKVRPQYRGSHIYTNNRIKVNNKSKKDFEINRSPGIIM